MSSLTLHSFGAINLSNMELEDFMPDGDFCLEIEFDITDKFSENEFISFHFLWATTEGLREFRSHNSINGVFDFRNIQIMDDFSYTNLLKFIEENIIIPSQQMNNEAFVSHLLDHFGLPL